MRSRHDQQSILGVSKISAPWQKDCGFKSIGCAYAPSVCVSSCAATPPCLVVLGHPRGKWQVLPSLPLDVRANLPSFSMKLDTADEMVSISSSKSTRQRLKSGQRDSASDAKLWSLHVHVHVCWSDKGKLREALGYISMHREPSE